MASNENEQIDAMIEAVRVTMKRLEADNKPVTIASVVGTISVLVYEIAKDIKG